MKALTTSFPRVNLSLLSQKLFTARTLTDVGILRPMRPDKLLRVADALRRWGPTPAAGYTI